MIILYVAEFSYGKAALATVELAKETPKTYQIIRHTQKHCLGRQYLPERLAKNKYNCFSTAEEAMDYLLMRARRYIKDLKAKQARTEDHYAELVQAKEELKGAR